MNKNAVGVVVSWYKEHGFGYAEIDGNGLNERIYLHFTAMERELIDGLKIGDKLQLNFEKNDRNGYSATSIERLFIGGK